MKTQRSNSQLDKQWLLWKNQPNYVGRLETWVMLTKSEWNSLGLDFSSLRISLLKFICEFHLLVLRIAWRLEWSCIACPSGVFNLNSQLVRIAYLKILLLYLKLVYINNTRGFHWCTLIRFASSLYSHFPPTLPPFLYNLWRV
jgi:hypothetical protein